MSNSLDAVTGRRWLREQQEQEQEQEQEKEQEQ